MAMFDPHTATGLSRLEGSTVVRFSVLAFSSILFLVDPFAALPTFLAVTAGQDVVKRRRTARKASLTSFVVLTIFAFGGRYIFRMFGITLPAFEIAGGRQKQKRRARRTMRASCPWAYPCSPGRARSRA
jgi:multiple antibiotic resistance protein